MEVIWACRPGRGDPKRQQVLDAMAIVPAFHHVIKQAKRTRTKAELCELIRQHQEESPPVKTPRTPQTPPKSPGPSPTEEPLSAGHQQYVYKLRTPPELYSIPKTPRTPRTPRDMETTTRYASSQKSTQPAKPPPSSQGDRSIAQEIERKEEKKKIILSSIDDVVSPKHTSPSLLRITRSQSIVAPSAVPTRQEEIKKGATSSVATRSQKIVELKRVSELRKQVRTSAVFIPIETEKRITWRILERIGAGGGGTVFKACVPPESKGTKSSECGYAVKVVKESSLHSGYRDVRYLQMLQPARLNNNTMLVPRFYDAFHFREERIPFSKELYIVMERWDGDMHELASRQGWLTVSQLTRMFELSIALGIFGLISGDNKLSQFLQKGGGREIVMTDFGFAGSSDPSDINEFTARLGWPAGQPAFKCPPAWTYIERCRTTTSAKSSPGHAHTHTHAHPPASVKMASSGFPSAATPLPLALPPATTTTPPKEEDVGLPCATGDARYPAYVNVLQLEASLLYSARYQLPVRSDDGKSKLGVFAGLHGLGRDSIFNKCIGYTDAYVDGIISTLKAPPFHLSFEKLYFHTLSKLSCI